MLGEAVVARCPGDIRQLAGDRLPKMPRRTAWVQNYLRWPVELTSLRSECFHIVDQGLMWYARFLRGGRILGSVHDLIAHLTIQGKLDLEPPPAKRKIIIRESIRQLCRLERIISISQHTADLLVREFQIPAQRIVVVHNHLDPVFTPMNEPERAVARQRFFGSSEYVVIHVGKASSYKNRLGALKAFDLLRQRLPAARMFLVHGPPNAQEAEFVAESGCANAVSFLPSISNEDLRQFYGAADVLIFPSFYEGFGWPPLEAMGCGCPVVSTTCASLAEVVGGAALTLDDPNDHQRIADLAYSILTETTTATDLRDRGRARAKLFAPEIALNRVAEVYRSMA